MRKFVAASAIVASLAITGGTAVAINHSSTATPVRTAAPTPTTVPAPGKSAKRGGHRANGILSEALANLVANGTITQSQADKILAEVKSVGTARRADRPKGDFGMGLKGILQDSTGSLAEALGITPEELRTELKAGKSIEDIAKAHGTDLPKVTASLKADADAKIDQLVASGKLTAAQATRIKAGLDRMIEATVDGRGLMGGHFGFGDGQKPRMGHHGGPNVGPPPTPPADAAPTPGPTPEAPTTEAPSTAAPNTAAPTTTLGG